MSNPTVRMYCGDTFPLVYRLTRKDPENVDMNVSVDLTDCTVYFNMINVHTNEIIVDKKLCVVKDTPADGWASYAFASEETQHTGMYKTSFLVEYKDGSVCSYPLNDFQMIHII